MSTRQLAALDNGLALTPPMGWNSWNKFRCDVSEDLIRDMADAMVSSGMKDAGYQYIIIDDCWQVDRDEQGNIIPDAGRFPSGMKALADYVHSKGLKFGLYSDAGRFTCQRRPGSRGYEFQDARQYAAWGVDYLKYDWCAHRKQNAEASYALMRDALKAAGRPIVFSICEWGQNKPWLWGKNVGNLWRTTLDIKDCWDCIDKKNRRGWTRILDFQNGLEKYAGPGHWNDPDMLEIGNGNMTNTEYRAHFSFWCLLAAPLIAGNDLRTMSPEIKEILANKEVIAIDQDSLGVQGHKVRDDGDFEVWSKELRDGSRAMILFNRSKSDKEISASWKEIGFSDVTTAKVRDLWRHKDLGKFKDSFSATVPSHGVVMVKVTP
ncbi:MAG: glycoside hydrolase family 27 protein [Calditrichaeota bacterium]|nr:glycoside hydrolase family 27 protein [Calditrichota bacterium]